MQYEKISIRDRATLRRLMGILDGMVSTMEDGGRIEIADAVTILQLFKFFEPEYRKMLDGMEGELSISGLEMALKTKRARAFVQGSRKLTLVLREYLDAEDGRPDEVPAKQESPLSLSRLEKKYDTVTAGQSFGHDRERTHTPGPASYR